MDPATAILIALNGMVSDLSITSQQPRHELCFFGAYQSNKSATKTETLEC
jgi:hypothetical protein